MGAVVGNAEVRSLYPTHEQLVSGSNVDFIKTFQMNQRDGKIPFPPIGTDFLFASLS